MDKQLAVTSDTSWKLDTVPHQRREIFHTIKKPPFGLQSAEPRRKHGPQGEACKPIQLKFYPVGVKGVNIFFWSAGFKISLNMLTSVLGAL